LSQKVTDVEISGQCINVQRTTSTIYDHSFTALVADIWHWWCCWWCFRSNLSRQVRCYTYLMCCVPQGSVIGSILFVLYPADVIISLYRKPFLSPYICWRHSSVRFISTHVLTYMYSPLSSLGMYRIFGPGRNVNGTGYCSRIFY